MSSEFERAAHHLESLDDFDHLLIDGLESSETSEVADEFWEWLEREVREKCEQKLDDSQ